MVALTGDPAKKAIVSQVASKLLCALIYLRISEWARESLTGKTEILSWVRLSGLRCRRALNYTYCYGQYLQNIWATNEHYILKTNIKIKPMFKCSHIVPPHVYYSFTETLTMSLAQWFDNCIGNHYLRGDMSCQS